MADITHPLGACPRPGCAAQLDPATPDRASAGEWIWTCANGHHGPRFISGRFQHR